MANAMGHFTVFDQLTLKSWTSTPPHAGAEIDLYTATSLDGTPTDLIESALADFEAAVAPALAHVNRTDTLPEGDRFDDLLGLIANLAIRTPAANDDYISNLNSAAKREMCRQFQDEEAYRRALNQMYGREPTADELAGFVLFIENGEYDIREEDAGTWGRFVAVGTAIIKNSLLDRNWGLVTATAGDFVCSDRPVVLTFNGPDPTPASFRPGFCTPSTWVIASLSKRHALVGTLDEAVLRGSLPLDGVAWINRKLIERSRRFIIHSTADFSWLNDGAIAHKRDLEQARSW